MGRRTDGRVESWKRAWCIKTSENSGTKKDRMRAHVTLHGHGDDATMHTYRSLRCAGVRPSFLELSPFLA